MSTNYNFWQNFISISISNLNNIKSCIELNLHDIPNYNPNEFQSIEAKHEFYRSFLEFLNVSNSYTGFFLTSLIPIRHIIEHYYTNDIPNPFPDSENQYVFFVPDVNQNAGNNRTRMLVRAALNKILSSASIILRNLEKYFMICFTHIPGWKIIPQIFNSNITPEEINYFKLNPDEEKDPDQVLFFMELAKIRCIVHVLRLFVEFENYVNIHKSARTSGNQMADYFNEHGLLPHNFRNMTIGKKAIPIQQYLNTKTFTQTIFMYNQSQIDLALTIIFFKLNLFPYEVNINNYIQALIDRMCWMFMGPNDEKLLNITKFSAPIILSEDNLFDETADNIYLPESLSSETIPLNSFLDRILCVLIPDFHKDVENTKKWRTCNVDFTYRSILRYVAVLRKLSVRNALKIIEIKRPEIPNGALEFSNLIKEVVNKKFDLLHSKIKTDIHKKHQDLLYPPMDKEWAMYKYSNEYINESSTIDLLYPEMRNVLTKIANEDTKQIFDHPSPSVAAVYEFIVLRIVKLLIGNSFNFEDSLIRYEDQIFEHMQNLETCREAPIMLQSFNRMVIYYEHRVYEFRTIFLCLGFLIYILCVNFPKKDLTLHCVSFIDNLKKQKYLMEKQVELDTISSNAETIGQNTGISQFTSDPNTSIHTSAEYADEVRAREEKTFF